MVKVIFEEVKGQDRAQRIVKNILSKPFIQNLLFTGPAGVGKRTTALLVARMLNCLNATGCGSCRNCVRISRMNFPDLHLLVPLSRKELLSDRVKDYLLGQTAPPLQQNEIITIDHVRDIITEAQRPTVEGRRVIIIVHVHRMRYVAVSALLKIIEEQPNNTLFILTTPQLSSIPDTIQSRCQVVRFNYLTTNQVLEVLNNKGIIAPIIVPGSPGDTIRFINSNSFDLSKRIFLKSPFPEKRYTRVINRLKAKEYDLRELIQNLLNWYQLLLYARLNPSLTSDEDILIKSRKMDIERITNTIEAILRINNILDFHPNRRLLVFNLLEALC